MGRLSLILMSFLNEGRISAFDERVEGMKLEHRFLFNGKIIKLLSLSFSFSLFFFLCFFHGYILQISVRHLNNL